MTEATINDLDSYAAALNDVASYVQPDQVDFRAAVPAGTELGRTELDKGGEAVWRKGASGQRIGNKELPDRVPLWNRITGDKSMVPPTIALSRVSQRPEQFTTRDPGIQGPEPIAESCDVCNMARQKVGNMTPRPFYSEYDLEAHYQILHPREYATREKKRLELVEAKRDERMERLIEMALSARAPLPAEEAAPRRGKSGE